MLTKLAEKAWDSLSGVSEKNDEDREVYVYGFYMIFSRVYYFLLTVLFGLLFHNLLESMVFFLLFSLIRGYAGGIHASTETACTIFTSLSFFAAVAMISIGTMFSLHIAGVVVLISSIICIFLIAPLDTAEKQLSESEKRFYRKKANLSLFSISTFAVVAFLIQRYSVFYACIVSLGLEEILLLGGWLKSISTTQKS